MYVRKWRKRRWKKRERRKRIETRERSENATKRNLRASCCFDKSQERNLIGSRVQCLRNASCRPKASSKKRALVSSFCDLQSDICILCASQNSRQKRTLICEKRSKREREKSPRMRQTVRQTNEQVRRETFRCKFCRRPLK